MKSAIVSCFFVFLLILSGENRAEAYGNARQFLKKTSKYQTVPFPSGFDLTREFKSAFQRGDIAVLQQLITEYDIDVKALDLSKNLLVDALHRNSPALVEILLKNGADLNQDRLRRSNFLYWAVTQVANPKMAKLSLENGAQSSEISRLLFTQLGSRRAYHEEIAELLTEASARLGTLEARDSRWGATPLMWAVEYNRKPIVELLLALGARHDARAILDSNRTALAFAIQENFGSPPSHGQVIGMLLNAGADLHTPNSQGPMPLAHCESKKQPGLAQMLKDEILHRFLTFLETYPNPPSERLAEQKERLMLSLEGSKERTHFLFQLAETLRGKSAESANPVLYRTLAHSFYIQVIDDKTSRDEDRRIAHGEVGSFLFHSSSDYDERYLLEDSVPLEHHPDTVIVEHLLEACASTNGSAGPPAENQKDYQKLLQTFCKNMAHQDRPTQDKQYEEMPTSIPAHTIVHLVRANRKLLDEIKSLKRKPEEHAEEVR